ncbi:hypothetical protein KKC06_06075 [Patescibacteria group bacterium]|nr:hypothetical protein [Patescibacteria group bacterium]
MGKNKNKKTSQDLYSDPYFEKKEKQDVVRSKVFISLIVVCFLSLIFGGWYIGRQFKIPFEVASEETEETDTNLQIVETSQLAKLEGLRDKDTDHDGLNDYDELYYHKTSPYLADSDSDRISDKIEIDEGTNPNCPQGGICNKTSDDSGLDNTNDLFSDLVPSQTAQEDIDLNNLSADQLRQILIDSGTPEESINQLDDETLLQAYNEILAEGDLSGNVNAATNQTAVDVSDQEAITYESLVNLTPDEIRQLLIQYGVPADSLESIDDETLQQIYLQSLTDNLQTVSETGLE